MRTADMQNHVPIGISFPKEVPSKIDSERGNVSGNSYLSKILENIHAKEGSRNKDSYFGTKSNQDSLDRRIGSLQSSESRRT